MARFIFHASPRWAQELSALNIDSFT